MKKKIKSIQKIIGTIRLPEEKYNRFLANCEKLPFQPSMQKVIENLIDKFNEESK
jgi:hypothetical protein